MSFFDLMNAFNDVALAMSGPDPVRKFHLRDVISVRGVMALNETEKAYIARVEVPGFDKNQISITSQGGVLTVATEDTEDSYLVPVRTSVRIPADGNLSNAKSALNNGVLTITIPRREIEVNTINIQ